MTSLKKIDSMTLPLVVCRCASILELNSADSVVVVLFSALFCHHHAFDA